MSEAIVDEEIIEERIYTVPLGKNVYGNSYTRRTRAPKAVKFLRNFVEKHWKLENGVIIIDPEVNLALWKRGIEKPPRKIKIRCIKSEEDTVEVFLA